MMKVFLVFMVAFATLGAACTPSVTVQPTEVVMIQPQESWTPSAGDIASAKIAAEAKEKAAELEYPRCRDRAQAEWRRLFVEAKAAGDLPELMMEEFVRDVCGWRP